MYLERNKMKLIRHERKLNKYDEEKDGNDLHLHPELFNLASQMSKLELLNSTEVSVHHHVVTVHSSHEVSQLNYDCERSELNGWQNRLF